MYFNNCKTIEELKKEYRRLALENHPDRGGDEATMKEINDAYEKRAKQIEAGATESEKAKAGTPEAFICIINTLVRMQGIDIEICGSWIWVSGNTYPNREELAKAGCKYSKNKKAWYWFEDCGNTARRRGHYSMSEIRAKYGSEHVATNELNALPA